jgi:hypothetical protein
MQVFISWSGARSKAIAEILRQWLPAVIQAVKPYYSPDDVSKGSRWSNEIGKELEASRVGLICLTRENREAPWILFEAGALSKNLDKSKVCPILFGIDPSDVEGPLVQFQSCAFGKDEMLRVIRMINSELGENALASGVLGEVFEMWWPKLEERVLAELAAVADSPVDARSERELLEEILGLSRSLASDRRSQVAPFVVSDLVSGYERLVNLVSDSSPTELSEIVRELALPIDYIARRASPDVFFGGRVVRSRTSRSTLRSALPVELQEGARTVEAPVSADEDAR